MNKVFEYISNLHWTLVLLLLLLLLLYLFFFVVVVFVSKIIVKSE